MSTTWVNERTLYVCAPRRSGHHAVMHWIMVNSAGPICFLNNCAPQTNPYTAGRVFDHRLPAGLDLQAEREGRWARKSLLICSYESRDLERVYQPDFDDAMSRWLGPSLNTANLLILRDPFNLIASMYRWVVQGTRWRPPLEALTALPALWKAYAKEFLEVTSLVPSPVVRISFNRWFSDAEYRRTLANILGISAADEGRDEVAHWGPNVWGDSFDNMAYNGRATEMKVLERWRQVADEPLYRSLVSDPELFELSTAIFGALPGTEQLMR